MLVLRRLFCNWEESDMVEWKKLGDLCNITTGRLNANQKDENGFYPFFTCDATPYKINKYAFDTEAILLSGNGSQVGHLNYYKGKFNAYQRTYVLDDFKGIQLFYLFHYLKCTIRPYIMKSAKKGAVPYITLPMLTEFEIPIPSKSEQERIVSILDTFTSSISNLKEQIKKRRKQYEYYRDQLLDLEGKEGVQMKTLKDLFETRNGYTPSTKNEEFWTDGVIPWFKMEDIRDNGRILTDSNLHITSKAIKGKGLFKANSIILATSATIGEHALILVDHLCNQRFTNFYPKKEFENLINMKFYYYYMFIVDEWCKQHTHQGGFASVDMEGLYKLEIPLPSSAEQLRIVTILDQFEASIANLEAQLKEREKQYEYYRNQLLTFE